jgi:hypothetical protein
LHLLRGGKCHREKTICAHRGSVCGGLMPLIKWRLCN